MQIERLIIKNFRNIESLNISFDRRMNVISGENAQGKTNIIEALWLFCGAKSFRGAKDSSFVRFGEKKGTNEITFISQGIKHTAKMLFSDKREAVLDENNIKSTSELAGILNAVVFSPLDIFLVSGGPDKRRHFLDVSIGQLYPNYVEILRTYSRAVMQRNKIIKEYKYDPSVSIMLDVFESEIAENGKKIISYRKDFLKKITTYLPEIFFGLSSGEEISTVYVANTDGSMLTETLKMKRKEDSFLGFTSAGPHRDDIKFLINGVSARNYGSQGQKRSIAIALKLSSLNVINEISGEYPVCLLDDVMSELDKSRQEYILNSVKDWQTFITCCDPSNVEKLSGGKVFVIRNGGVV